PASGEGLPPAFVAELRRDGWPDMVVVPLSGTGRPVGVAAVIPEGEGRWSPAKLDAAMQAGGGGGGGAPGGGGGRGRGGPPAAAPRIWSPGCRCCASARPTPTPRGRGSRPVPARRSRRATASR